MSFEEEVTITPHCSLPLCNDVAMTVTYRPSASLCVCPSVCLSVRVVRLLWSIRKTQTAMHQSESGSE